MLKRKKDYYIMHYQRREVFMSCIRRQVIQQMIFMMHMFHHTCDFEVSSSSRSVLADLVKKSFV